MYEICRVVFFNINLKIPLVVITLEFLKLVLV